MIFTIQGNNIKVETHDESFYICKDKIKTGMLDIIEVGYEDIEKLKELIGCVERSAKYELWKSNKVLK